LPQYGFEAQLKIYSRALQGKTEEGFPISLEDWRSRARERLSDGPWWYLEGAAGGEETMKANREAFQRWKIRPRMLRNVDERDLTVELFGHTYPVPFLLAPIGVQSILHPDAERATARAAAGLGVPFTLSTVSSVPLEAVATEMGNAPRWFQLYPGRDPDVNASLVARAEQAGYTAIVVTVDTTVLGWREHDLKNAFLPFLQGEGIANYLTDPAFAKRLGAPPTENIAAAIQEFLEVYVNPAFTWRDLAELRKRTDMPLLVKGITHPEDAKEAMKFGADGVVVSNHGGRQVDGAIASLDALVEIRDAVGDEYPLLFDSGIRRAADVLKALALGANAVLIGRPYAYALAVGGEEGVRHWLSLTMAELDLELALAGYASVREIDRSFVTRV
jgi:lactate 2-monooxygenase